MALADARLEGLLLPALKEGIKRLSLREQIAGSLADLVAAGLLREGDELPPERDLAAMLEVSRDICAAPCSCLRNAASCTSATAPARGSASIRRPSTKAGASTCVSSPI